MSNTFNDSSGVVANPTSARKNPDTSYTYSAELSDVDVTWTIGATTYNCKAVVNIEVTTPTGMPQVTTGGGNMFRFNEDGGYGVHISGVDWT